MHIRHNLIRIVITAGAMSFFTHCNTTQNSARVAPGTTITIPEKFSPDGDGINDTWEILHLDRDDNIHTQIYSRFGMLLFEQKGSYQPWDGTYKGREIPYGTYYYVISRGKGFRTLTGWVALSRNP